MIRCLDSLQAFLAAGFRAREQAGTIGVRCGDDGGGGTRRPEAMTSRDWAAQFRVDLRNCGVTDVEEACLWARYVMEGRPGAVSSQATAADFADFIEREWGIKMPRFTPRSVKLMIRGAEQKISRRRPWVRE